MPKRGISLFGRRLKGSGKACFGIRKGPVTTFGKGLDKLLARQIEARRAKRALGLAQTFSMLITFTASMDFL
ncbi:hypothetical protein [Collinsella sp. AK_207A]|uniref:hypothetical protein n=1 Tax=Collinsella sp. AK_207A TaxID=2650472 RepID=UPI0012607A30|nr:hypothetical protein [Collinsella sp. AK_207A]